ncbi:TAXI family TRAP transporter solute-binding subunit [Methylobacterium sp. CM6257]
MVLGYFNLHAKDVSRTFPSVDDLANSVQQQTLAAVRAVGPMAAGEVVDVVARRDCARDTGFPGILAPDEAETIGKRFPGFESIDVPAAAFRARPATPSDSVTTLAVTYRFAASELMPNVVAAAIARSILTTKAKLVAVTPLASQIEAPDPDDKTPILSVHPGVTAYLSNGDQRLFASFSSTFTLAALWSICPGRSSRPHPPAGTDVDRGRIGGRSSGWSRLPTRRRMPIWQSSPHWRANSIRSSHPCWGGRPRAVIPIAIVWRPF